MCLNARQDTSRTRPEGQQKQKGGDPCSRKLAGTEKKPDRKSP